MAGRSREELLAAAAALLAVMHEVDDGAAAAVLAKRAKQFEDESMDAAPISAAGQVTDERLAVAAGNIFATGAASALFNAGAPGPLAEAFARKIAARVLEDPATRLSLIQMARHAVEGRCSCGRPDGHDDGHGQPSLMRLL